MANPSGTFTINHGAATTTSRDVTLQFYPIDGDFHIDKAYVGSTPFSLSAMYDITTDGVFTLPNVAGLRTLYLQFQDVAFNRSPTVTASITLEAVVPPIAKMFINDSALTTNSADVNLTFIIEGGSSSQYKLSNNALFTGATWRYASANPSKMRWSLNGLGNQTVYLKIKDSYNVESVVVSKTIQVLSFTYSDFEKLIPITWNVDSVKASDLIYHHPSFPWYEIRWTDGFFDSARSLQNIVGFIPIALTCSCKQTATTIPYQISVISENPNNGTQNEREFITVKTFTVPINQTDYSITCTNFDIEALCKGVNLSLHLSDPYMTFSGMTPIVSSEPLVDLEVTLWCKIFEFQTDSLSEDNYDIYRWRGDAIENSTGSEDSNLLDSNILIETNRFIVDDKEILATEFSAIKHPDYNSYNMLLMNLFDEDLRTINVGGHFTKFTASPTTATGKEVACCFVAALSATLKQVVFYARQYTDFIPTAKLYAATMTEEVGLLLATGALLFRPTVGKYGEFIFEFPDTPIVLGNSYFISIVNPYDYTILDFYYDSVTPTFSVYTYNNNSWTLNSTGRRTVMYIPAEHSIVGVVRIPAGAPSYFTYMKTSGFFIDSLPSNSSLLIKPGYMTPTAGGDGFTAAPGAILNYEVNLYLKDM